MHARGKSLLLLAGLSVLLLVAGCDSGDSEPPEPDRCEDPDALNTGEAGECEYPTEPDMVEISATLTAESGELSSPEITFGDETVSGSEATREFEESNDELIVTGTADGFVAQSQTVTLSADREVAFTLEADAPEDVEIEFVPRAVDGDSVLTDASVSGAAEGAGQFTATLPFGTSELCVTGEAEYFENAEECFTPDTDRTGDDAVVIELERETISASVSATPADALITITEPGGDVRDGAEATGSVETTLPKRDGERKVSFSLDGYSDGTMTVSAAEDIEISVELMRVYACSDGEDNNRNGLADDREPGCVDDSGDLSRKPDGTLVHYDPTDDSEIVLTRNYRYSKGVPEKKIVASDGPQEMLWADSFTNLRSTIEDAIGEVRIYLTASGDDRDEQTVAIRLATGTGRDDINNVNTTDIVPDLSNEEMELIQFHGADRSWFQDGYEYRRIDVLHGCAVPGNPLNLACDGDDAVTVFEDPDLPGLQGSTFIISHNVEQEDVPTEASSLRFQSTTALESGECIETEDSLLCKDVPQAEISKRLRAWQ